MLRLERNIRNRICAVFIYLMSRVTRTHSGLVDMLSLRGGRPTLPHFKLFIFPGYIQWISINASFHQKSSLGLYSRSPMSLFLDKLKIGIGV